jgi:putative transposase
MLYQSIGISKQAVHKYLERLCKNKSDMGQLLLIVYKIREDHPTMCCRDMYYKINPKFIGRDAFERFCKDYGLMSAIPKNYRKTTDSRGVTRFENLLENTTIADINQVWQSDITYYELSGMFYYITFIIDSFSRRIVGYNVSKRLTTEQTTLPSLEMAIKTRKNAILEGLIFHSDGGGQYYDKEFLKLTRSQGIINSMCEYPWENGVSERINGVIKNNYLRHRNIKTYADLVKEVDRSVLLYNHEKPHIRLNRKTPFQFEKDLLTLHQQAKLMMTESFDANKQILGAFSPKKSEQAKPQNQDVLSAYKLEMSE